MENRHGRCTGNSSGEQTRNISKKCYSLPMLQKENEKLKEDMNLLRAAHDDKEILLSEALRKLELLEKENQELKKGVETKDASTYVRIEIVDVSTSSIDTSDVSKSSIDTSGVSASSIDMQSVLPAPSDVYAQSDIPGENEPACKTLLFEEIVCELPYKEAGDVIMFDKNMKETELLLNMGKHFKKIGGSNISKVVNNILNAIATKNVQKKFVWDDAADNSFQNLTNILRCIYSVVCSEDISQHQVNNIIKNTLKNARSKS